MWGNQAKVGARRYIAFPHYIHRQDRHTPSISLAAHLTYATAGLLPAPSFPALTVCALALFQVKQLIFFAFALGKAAGFASTPRPDPKTCGSCQVKPDLTKTAIVHKTIGTKRLDKDYLNKHQLRILSKQLGTDISRKNSQKLIDLYGTENGTVSINDILQKSATMAPSKHFWLNIDPDDNGIRQTRPKWNEFAKSGMLTRTRIAHYGIGLMSLFIGTVDSVDFVLSGGAPDISIHDANVHACIHTLAAFFSLFRFSYTWTEGKPWYLWMPTAREANTCGHPSWCFFGTAVRSIPTSYYQKRLHQFGAANRGFKHIRPL